MVTVIMIIASLLAIPAVIVIVMINMIASSGCDHKHHVKHDSCKLIAMMNIPGAIVVMLI